MSPATTEFGRREHLGQPWAEHWLRFAGDMRTIGLFVHECQGRNGWGGPAVTVPAERLPEIMSATKVTLDTHADAGCVVLYPAPIRIEEG